jgi:hypothetical protein
VYLDWACDQGVAGNVLILETNGKRLRHTVAGTGSGWSNYKVVKIGTLAIPAGRHKLVAQPEGQPRGALCDLRRIILVNEGAPAPKQ